MLFFLLQKEIGALKELCSHLGGKEDEIAACKPRRKSKGTNVTHNRIQYHTHKDKKSSSKFYFAGILSRLDTSMGLTSVASLSLSLSMSMSGGVLNMARANPMINRRESLQDNLPARVRGPGITGLSRPSIISNSVRDTSPIPRRLAGKTSMEAVIEESPLEEEKKANGAMVSGDTLAVPSSSTQAARTSNADVEKLSSNGSVSVQTIVHEENEIPQKSPHATTRGSIGRVTPPSTGGTPPRLSPSTPPLASPHSSWMHLGPLEGTSSLGGSAVLSPKTGTSPRGTPPKGTSPRETPPRGTPQGSPTGEKSPLTPGTPLTPVSPGTPSQSLSGFVTPASLSPATPPSPGPPMLIPLSKSPRQDRRRRPPPVPPKPKKLKGILKHSEDSGRGRTPSPIRGRTPSPISHPVYEDFDHDKSTSPLLQQRARTPSPRMHRRSRTPSPRMDRKVSREKEKRGKVLSKKGKRRHDRPRSSVQLDFENELAAPGQPPRRARSSETIVVANGPLVRGLSPSLSALRSSREDVMVRLQRRPQTSTDDSRVSNRTFIAYF